MKLLNNLEGASRIITDPLNRFVTDTEKSTWNAAAIAIEQSGTVPIIQFLSMSPLFSGQSIDSYDTSFGSFVSSLDQYMGSQMIFVDGFYAEGENESGNLESTMFILRDPLIGGICSYTAIQIYNRSTPQLLTLSRTDSSAWIYNAKAF